MRVTLDSVTGLDTNATNVDPVLVKLSKCCSIRTEGRGISFVRQGLTCVRTYVGLRLFLWKLQRVKLVGDKGHRRRVPISVQLSFKVLTRCSAILYCRHNRHNAANYLEPAFYMSLHTVFINV